MDEPVVKNDVALTEKPYRFQRKELRITRPSANQIQRADSGWRKGTDTNSLAAGQTCTRSLMTSNRYP